MRSIRLVAILAGVLAPLAAAAQDTGADWPLYNRTYDSQRYSALADITAANVQQLRPLCSFDTGETTSFQTGPVVVDGTMYLTTDQNTYAIDAGTCALRWKNEHRYSPPSYLKVNRGVAYLDGKLFRGAGDGHVFAIDARTGRTVWDVAIADPKRGESVPAAPIAWQNMVFIGNAGGDNFGVTGRLYALDAATGRTLWHFDMVPPSTSGGTALSGSSTGAAAQRAAQTWPPPTPQVPRAGGATWTSYTLDPETGRLYVPGGNAAPDFVKALRPGENLYTNSIVVLDARTGALEDFYPLTPNDFHDYDVSAAPVLVTTKSGRRLVAEAGKDGRLYGIDPAARRLLYGVPTTTIENADAPLMPQGTRFCPGTQGGTEWNGPAYLPATNALYVNAADWCSTVHLMPPEQLQGKPGEAWTGAADENPFGTFDPKEKWRGWLTAFDADSGRILWRHQAATPLLAGVLATAGGLIFTADLDGRVIALDAGKGDVLWHGKVEGAVGGGVISYRAGGRQRIAVAAGMNSPIWPLPKSTGKIVVFGLS